MATDEFLSPDQLSQIDGHASLANLGQIELNHPTTSLGGDGRLDTEVEISGNEVITASDFAHDGYADELKIVDSDGDYSTWEYRHEADGSTQWVETEHGHLDGGTAT
jgi:hypothetical protein